MHLSQKTIMRKQLTQYVKCLECCLEVNIYGALTVYIGAVLRGLPWWLSREEDACQKEMRVRSRGQGDPLEKEMGTHSSILAWRVPWTEEPGRPWSMGSQRGGQDRAHRRAAPRPQRRQWTKMTAVSGACVSTQSLNFHRSLIVYFTVI